MGWLKLFCTPDWITSCRSSCTHSLLGLMSLQNKNSCIYSTQLECLGPTSTAQASGASPLQLFVCFCGHNRGNSVTRQHPSHCVRDAIAQSYRVGGMASPLGIRAHSTRSVASTSVQALDVCLVAGWYSLHIHQVL